MDIKYLEVTLHPRFLDALFAYKNQAMNIFRDVLGLYDIHYLAVARIDQQGQLLSFSSTPVMEFNLFNSALWRYDLCYRPQWFTQCTQASWMTLYETARYDELYFLKQVKHAYRTTRCLAARIGNEAFIYALASQYESPELEERFVRQVDELYKIGQYCTNLLLPYFEQCQTESAPILSRMREIEVSS